ncbi:MAG TPA: class I SAM-dependent methyltransferase [Bryobacteraceae bacterium]|nr:class I SAM-dependent methyltransferase [Bryobacteraceae bacterium]
MRAYAGENVRRGALMRRHLEFIGEMSPFLEIGANAGHTSYMLANEFGADGFALDISADALRYGIAIQDEWGMARAPVRIAGDAVHLPFADGSLRFVLAFQMLSQFMDIESVFVEVKRVLAPGGVFLFSEEPLKRMLTLSIYRAPYYDTMKPWERRLYDWGLLGYVIRDVVGAHQEESFGIRQNHSMVLRQWHALITKHFVEHKYEILVRETGWGERVVRRAAIALDRHRSEWLAARLLGGTLAAVCRKAGGAREIPQASPDRFETYLRCPDCRAPLRRDAADTLACTGCAYTAANEGGVYNLLPSATRSELYPGDREDIIDMSIAGHEAKLREGWYELEGVFGNRYRWIGERAVALLRPAGSGPQKVRIRGFAHEAAFAQKKPVTLEVRVNAERAGLWTLDRSGLFVLEAPLAPGSEYRIEVLAGPVWQAAGDDRRFTVNLSMLRLLPAE